MRYNLLDVIAVHPLPNEEKHLSFDTIPTFVALFVYEILAKDGHLGATDGHHGASDDQFGASDGQLGASGGQCGPSEGKHGPSNGQLGPSDGQLPMANLGPSIITNSCPSVIW